MLLRMCAHDNIIASLGSIDEEAFGKRLPFEFRQPLIQFDGHDSSLLLTDLPLGLHVW